MTISKTRLPDNSILKTDNIKYDYIDSFQGQFTDKFHHNGITEIGKYFFASSPKWIDKLFAFRNKLVGLFGLKTPGNISDRQKMIESLKFENGEQIGLFKIYEKTANEIVIGEDDKHLNFRVSLFLEHEYIENANKILIISTTVKFNNWFGRVYFLPVRPFHKLIVNTMLKEIIKNIENRTEKNQESITTD